MSRLRALIKRLGLIQHSLCSKFQATPGWQRSLVEISTLTELNWPVLNVCSDEVDRYEYKWTAFPFLKISFTRTWKLKRGLGCYFESRLLLAIYKYIIHFVVFHNFEAIRL